MFGSVAEVKLHKKGGYGFVKFDLHESAVKAIVHGHSEELHGRVRIVLCTFCIVSQVKGISIISILRQNSDFHCQVLKCAWGKSAASSGHASALLAPGANQLRLASALQVHD